MRGNRLTKAMKEHILSLAVRVPDTGIDQLIMLLKSIDTPEDLRDDWPHATV